MRIIIHAAIISSNPKTYRAFSQTPLQLEEQYLKTLQLLKMNPHHLSIRMHDLSGKLQGLHSIPLNLLN